MGTKWLGFLRALTKAICDWQNIMIGRKTRLWDNFKIEVKKFDGKDGRKWKLFKIFSKCGICVSLSQPRISAAVMLIWTHTCGAITTEDEHYDCHKSCILCREGGKWNMEREGQYILGCNAKGSQLRGDTIYNSRR